MRFGPCSARVTVQLNSSKEICVMIYETHCISIWLLLLDLDKRDSKYQFCLCQTLEGVSGSWGWLKHDSNTSGHSYQYSAYSKQIIASIGSKSTPPCHVKASTCIAIVSTSLSQKCACHLLLKAERARHLWYTCVCTGRCVFQCNRLLNEGLTLG